MWYWGLLSSVPRLFFLRTTEASCLILILCFLSLLIYSIISSHQLNLPEHCRASFCPLPSLPSLSHHPVWLQLIQTC